MGALLDGKRITLGVCYYPEHWPEENWAGDMKRMLETGIETVRVGEFAWSYIERTEGVFNYDFFNRFLDAAEKAKMKVIFCTPTATPPAWLTEKYTECLNADINGVLYRHGARRHYNYNSVKYRELASRIVENSAKCYAPRECVIGWQIDNEINCEINEFYSESDTKAFRTFLLEKYGTLDALNAVWGTAFWNQTYTDWNEVHVPRRTAHLSQNPHEELDYKRFVSASARSFVKMQSDILRKYIKPGDFVTTNGIFGNLDSRKMTEESLDFLTYDSYPNFGYMLDAPFDENGMKDRKWSKNLSLARSMSGAFGIMEQQSGANGWNCRMVAPSPRPGQITLWTMQSIAHGADYIGYFRWRTAVFGTEMYWHGILDYSGRDNRRLAEIAEIHKKIAAMDDIAGSRYMAEAGILRDCDNDWDAELDIWHKAVSEASEKALFQAFEHTHTPFDYVNIDDDTKVETLLPYKVLFYPHAAIMSKARAEVLKSYAEAGGTLVFGCRSGYKDMRGHCIMENLPGLLSSITGADIPEYSFIAPDAPEAEIDWNGAKMKGEVFTEFLSPLSGATLEAKYTCDYYAESGALVSKKLGKGKAYYYGTAWNEESAKVFLQKLEIASPYASLLTLPPCCELAVRGKADARYAFILNYSKEEAAVDFAHTAKDVFTGAALKGSVALKGYGTMVAML